MGFIKWLYYEKLREKWALDPCEIVLDELPHLGVYVEIEGPTRETVHGIVKKLKLPRRFINATYVEMLQEHAREAERSTQDFKFPSRHTFILGEETSVAS